MTASRSLLDRRLLHVIELRKALREVGIALGLDAVLVGAGAVRRALAVSRVKLVDDIHPRNDLAERRKAHAVELAVVGEIDEHLRRARIRSRRREGDHAARIVLRDLVVRYA